MELQTLTYIVVGFTFALYVGIAIWARAGSAKEFYVAGGGVPPVANGMATAADWMSAASFISMAGLISGMGFAGGVYLMGWTGGYVLVNSLMAPYLRKFGCYTVPDFIGTRYGGNLARFIAVVILVVVSFTYVTAQINASGSETRSESGGVQAFPQTLPNGDVVQVVTPFESQNVESTFWQLQLRQTVFRWDQFIGLQQADKRVAEAEANLGLGELCISHD